MSATKVQSPGICDYALNDGFELSIVPGAEPGGDAVPYLWFGERGRYMAVTPDLKMFKSIIKNMQKAVEFYESA